MIEAAKIQRILYNLIQNAIRRTPEEGSVFISVSSTDNGVQVNEVDTGEGIAGQDLPYIFNEFYRGEKSRNRNTGGAGLGLAIAKGIVEAHSARILFCRGEASNGSLINFKLTSQSCVLEF